MHYNWELILAPGESLQREFGSSKHLQIVVLIIAALVNILLASTNIVLALFIFFAGIMYYWYLLTAKHFALTNKRIIIVESFLGLHIINIDYSQVTETKLVQNPFGSIGGWGELYIHHGAINGVTAPMIRLGPIDRPQEIKKIIDEMQEKSKQTA